MSQCSESSERSELWGKTGARTKNRPSPRHWSGQSAEKALRSPDRRHLLLRLVINRKFTFMILSPVLRIPSWPAGPFSEIFEIKIPCKRKQKNIALQTATRVSPTILSYSRYFLAPEKGDSYMKRSWMLVWRHLTEQTIYCKLLASNSR